MNKKAIVGDATITMISLIIIATLGVASVAMFSFDVFGTDVDQVIKERTNLVNSNEVMFNFLNSKTKFNEQEISIIDLIVLSVKEKNYEQLKIELEKNLAIPEVHWFFSVKLDGENLFLTNRDGWAFDEVDIAGKYLNELDLITPLFDYPKLQLIFTIRNGHKVGTKLEDIDF